mmetsp:Transcript_4273/g.10337  ORF Transcript_4273/g.10337 Transcript_4273/m.10337 type:complete len:577 (+) Transcript_4273:2298-4028(+)
MPCTSAKTKNLSAKSTILLSDLSFFLTFPRLLLPSFSFSSSSSSPVAADEDGCSGTAKLAAADAAAAAAAAAPVSGAKKDPGAKSSLEQTYYQHGGTRGPDLRGDVNGIPWASARILALDAAQPGWFPPQPNSWASYSSGGAGGGGGGSNNMFAGTEWQRLLPPALVPGPSPPQLLSVAPMMEYTTAHFRYLCRLLSSRTWLYTEMEVDRTLVHTEHPRLDRFLDFPTQTHPSALQLGGSDPELLALATAIAAPYGYDEINLNCGCPSPKVAGKGAFGAALMLEPSLVAECVAAMAENSGGAPVTVKCRIGVDDVDSYSDLCRFVETVAAAMPPAGVWSGDCRPLFAIHARKALLKGLSPAENRTVPPLRYEWVYALARDFPELGFVLNGGVTTAEEAAAVVRGAGVPQGGGRLVGTMIGRAVHANPWGVLGNADVAVFGAESNPCKSRRELLEKYAVYCQATHGRYGVTKDGYTVPSVRHLMHPLQNLFQGQHNAKVWRREVDEVLKQDAKKPGASVADVLERTLGVLSDEVLDAPPGPDWPPAGGGAAPEPLKVLPAMPAAVVRGASRAAATAR